MPGSSYSTVLVGTDGSASSVHAVARAAVIARNAGAQLLIACVSPKPRGGSEPADAPAAAQDAVGTAVEQARAAGADNVDKLLLYGDPVDELADVAKQRKADLVVVGNRGIDSLSGRLLGSVPANLSHRVLCDVLIVHTTGHRR